MSGKTPGVGGFEARTSPAERRDFFDIRRLIGGRINWGGAWSANKVPYAKNDLVTNDGWTMVCVEPTGCTDRPAPQPFGDPFWVYEGTSPTITGNNKTVTFGNRYTFDQPGYLTGYRIWTVAGNVYRVFSIVDPGGADEISELPLISSATGGWVEFGLADTLVSVGTTFELACIVSVPGGTATPIPGDWLYDTPQNTRIPGDGEIIHANSSTSVLSVSKQDVNGPVDLTALTVGDTIDVSGNSWAIQSITDEITHWNFGIAPAVQIAPDGVYEFTFNTVVATPISFLQDPNYWPTTPYAVQGLLGVDGASPVLDDNAYGTDIKVQPASISDQWEAVASGGSGSSNSVDTAPVFLYDVQNPIAGTSGRASLQQMGSLPIYTLNITTFGGSNLSWSTNQTIISGLPDVLPSTPGTAMRFLMGDSVSGGGPWLCKLVATTGGGMEMQASLNLSGVSGFQGSVTWFGRQ